jgi:hypothetical protein
MKRALLTMAMALGLASGASAHIGDKIYLIFEIPERIVQPRLKDGNIAVGRMWSAIPAALSALRSDR